MGKSKFHKLSKYLGHLLGHSSLARPLSLPRGILYLNAGLLILCLVVLLRQELRLGAVTGENEELKSAVTSQQDDIELLRRKNAELERQFLAAVEEVKRVQNLESKLRKLIGIDPKNAGRLSNQGNLPPFSSLERAEASHEKAQTLEEKLERALLMAAKARSRMPGTPTLSPVRDPDAYLSGGYGWRMNPITGQGDEFHAGLDIVAPLRAPIVATADGRVLASNRDPWLGEYVKIEHPSGISTIYGHMTKRIVKEGSWVKRGTVIGFMGNTGRSTGTHLHYSVEVKGRFVDPSDYILETTLAQKRN